MRIISQDKEFDLPYKETTLRAFDNGEIGAFSLIDLESNDFIVMAKYSTKEKAIKAMEMRREYYDSIFLSQIQKFFNSRQKRRSKMNNQQAIDRLVEHLEWGWTEETVAAIEMGIHALKETQWIPISERLPEDESYILVSFKNSTMPDIARYEENDEGGTFYPGDDEKSYSSYGFFVNAWMPLPEPYKGE